MSEKQYKSISANLKCSNGKEYMLIQRNDGVNICQVCSKHTAKEIVDELNNLAEENEQLKSFKDKVFDLLDKKLEEYPYLTLTEKWDNNCKYKHSCRENHEKNVAYASINTTLNKLKKELKND